MERTRPRTLLFFTATTSLIVAVVDAALYSRNFVGAESLLLAWSLAFYVLVAMWVSAYSHGRTGIYRPFDFGFPVYLILPLYLPYYLLRTRGPSGLLWLVGIVGLCLLSWPLRLAVWHGA